MYFVRVFIFAYMEYIIDVISLQGRSHMNVSSVVKDSHKGDHSIGMSKHTYLKGRGT